MIYFGLLTIVLIYIYLYKRQKEIIKYLPLSKSGLINLYAAMESSSSYFSIYKFYFNIAGLFLIIIVITKVLKINFIYTVFLLLINLLLMPLIIIWRLNYYKEEYDFNNLVTYINQFIIVFKTYPKVYTTLIEIEDSISGELANYVNNSIEQIKNGKNSYDALASINQRYPHFIVYNLHSLVYSIEQFGSNDYFEALDLIQDDLDDWVEDVLNYNYDKKSIIRKVVILIGFAFVICLIALNMLFTANININAYSYQVSMFVFCLVQILTYVTSLSLLNSKWIESSETI